MARRRQALTEFQRSVYNEVRRIPQGSVTTYAQIARAIGKPNAARAIGATLHKNFNPRVPCHRVIKSDGRVGAYNRGVERKIRILKKEEIKIIGNRISTPAYFWKIK